MSLNEFVAERKRAIHAALLAGEPPPEGEFDEQVFLAGKEKGEPQVGAARFSAASIALEFIYPEAGGVATVLTVTLPSPERIVHMPIPGWVVESVWQGEVAGSFHFESDAHRLLADFAAELEFKANAKWFEPARPKHRE